MKENEEKITTYWNIHSYPFFVEYSIIDKDEKLLDFLLEQIEKHNAWVDSSIEEIKKNHPIESDFKYFVKFFNGRKVYLLQSTLDYLLSKKEFIE